MKLEDVEAAMLNYWRITNKNKDETHNNDDDDHETSFSATDGDKT